MIRAADTPTIDFLVRELPTVGALTIVALAAIALAWKAVEYAFRASDNRTPAERISDARHELDRAVEQLDPGPVQSDEQDGSKTNRR